MFLDNGKGNSDVLQAKTDNERSYALLLSDAAMMTHFVDQKPANEFAFYTSGSIVLNSMGCFNRFLVKSLQKYSPLLVLIYIDYILFYLMALHHEI